MAAISHMQHIADPPFVITVSSIVGGSSMKFAARVISTPHVRAIRLVTEVKLRLTESTRKRIALSLLCGLLNHFQPTRTASF